MGSPTQMFTPRSLNQFKFVGLDMPMFIASYKGGRNESFMYGKDTKTL